MRKRYPGVLILLLTAVSCGPGAVRDTTDGTGEVRSITLSIVGTNDVHGRIIEDDGAGGLALFGGYLANLRDARARDGGAVMLIDAGDMWQGTLESNIAEGAPVVAAYNALGYAAAAVGNHEFDFGPVGPEVMPKSIDDDPRGALKARAGEANFPLLAANLIDEATGAAVFWPNVKPSVVVAVAGIDVGIIGLTSRNTLRTTLSANVLGLRIAGLAETIVAEAAKLRAAGADMIIVTAHAGGDCGSFEDPADLGSCDPDSEIFAVARALPAQTVDLIIGGHVHKGMAHEVNGIAVISSWSGGNFFGRVDFRIAGDGVLGRRILAPTRICRYVDTESGHCEPAAVAGKSILASYEGKPVIPDARIARIIEPAIESAAALKAEKLGPVLETPFTRQPDPASAIGNLLTDIMLASDPQADVAIHNTLGGIRADLPAGELTYGSVYEMFPFDNRIVQIALTGAELRAVVANQIEGPVRRGNVSGIRVIANCDDDGLIVSMIDRTGREIGDDERLLVVSNDFLTTGGDVVFTPIMPAEGFDTGNDGPLMRDVIVAWMRDRGGTLNADEFIDSENPRWSFPGTAPVECRASAM
ncbi:MAG: bifunctional metallophosphatase/5'-nucleotidase [Gammaproteobacteria bacterium]|nr:bifunctional metallophosphatase/5'-nucleotidase [Gammaproteobacteria bacterium]